MSEFRTRRRVLRLGGLAVAAASAGCLSPFGNEPGDAAVALRNEDRSLTP